VGWEFSEEDKNSTCNTTKRGSCATISLPSAAPAMARKSAARPAVCRSAADDSFSNHTQLSLEVRGVRARQSLHLAGGFHPEASGDVPQTLLAVRSGTAVNYHFQQLHGPRDLIADPPPPAQHLGFFLRKVIIILKEKVSHPLPAWCHNGAATIPLKGWCASA